MTGKKEFRNVQCKNVHPADPDSVTRFNLSHRFAVTKLIAVFVIVVAGLVVFCRGDIDHFTGNPFEGSQTNLGELALSLYSGLFSYAGWLVSKYLGQETD